MKQSSVIDHIHDDVQDPLQEGDTTVQRLCNLPKFRCGQKTRRVDLKSQEAEAEEASETFLPRLKLLRWDKTTPKSRETITSRPQPWWGGGATSTNPNLINCYSFFGKKVQMPPCSSSTGHTLVVSVAFLNWKDPSTPWMWQTLSLQLSPRTAKRNNWLLLDIINISVPSVHVAEAQTERECEHVRTPARACARWPIRNVFFCKLWRGKLI